MHVKPYSGMGCTIFYPAVFIRVFATATICACCSEVARSSTAIPSDAQNIQYGLAMHVHGMLCGPA
jgi:hypothetical protein